MQKLATGLALAFFMTGCGSDRASEVTQSENTPPPPAAEQAEELHSGLLLDYMDKQVRPGDDFNAFVSGGWMATAEIPPDRASNTVGLEVHEQATENVRLIIEASAEGDFPEGSDEQKVGDLYTAYMDMDTRNELGAAPLAPDFNAIDALENRGDLAVYFAEANKLGIGVPFALGQYAQHQNDLYTLDKLVYLFQGTRAPTAQGVAL